MDLTMRAFQIGSGILTCDNMEQARARAQVVNEQGGRRPSALRQIGSIGR
jgi:6,7-dimethyl-8-ribityllumazine synthase